MPVRRSARLRNLRATPEDFPSVPGTHNNNDNNKKNTNKKSKSLDPVTEHEEPPVLDKPVRPPHSPAPTTIARTPKSAHSQKKSPVKTPTSAITRPTHQEMHPSKVYQSTTKQPDSGLVLGFNPIRKDAQGNVVTDNPVQNTPSKTNASPGSAYYGTPAFEFKFSCQESQLSDEAKKLMESVREDVARIKSQMIHEKHTQTGSGTPQTSDRKIAKPKSKAGRFSNAHIAEFKKMDSIAGHPSAFRATPGRFQPVQKSLKRTNSKARLDETQTHTSPAGAAPKASPATATPSAKRVKHDRTDERLTTPKQAASRPRSGFRSSLMTPTRASMARASISLKPHRTSMIPSLARSPMSRPAEVPSTPRTDFNPRFKSNLPTLGGLKSILRRHQPLFSKDPSKIAAGTHLAAPDFTSDLLVRPSRETSQEPTQTPSPKKRVEFTPLSKSRDADELISPSPSKIPAVVPFSFTSDVAYPTLPTLTPDRAQVARPASIRTVRQSEVPVEATLPEIPGMPHGISHKKRHRVTEDEPDGENVPPIGPSLDERSAKRLKPNPLSPSKAPTSSPLKSRSHTPMRSASGASRMGTPGSARSKTRGALSISRLNLLAQPKHRS